MHNELQGKNQYCNKRNECYVNAGFRVTVSCRLKEMFSVHLEFHCIQFAACICQFVIFSV